MPESPSKLRARLTSGAACLYDPELHDGPADGRESVEEKAAREAVAIEVCAACPLLTACEKYRRRVRPVSGVWAGKVVTPVFALAEVA